MVFCSPYVTTFPLTLFNMFFKLANVQSSNIRSLTLNYCTNQAIVQFINNAKTYLYDNVSCDAILDFMTDEDRSAGKFVNAFCKGNRYTVVG